MLENEEIGTGKILTKNGKMYVEIVELKKVGEGIFMSGDKLSQRN